jgi:CBS-domain-containing membrane protein
MLAKLEFASFPVVLPGAPAARAVCVNPDAPASMVMTDFRSAPVVTTRCDTRIGTALDQMKHAGARFAFVIDRDQQLLGSVTSYDIQGEKPVQHMLAMGCTESSGAWGDVLVENIMDPVANWRVLDHAQVVRMSVAEMSLLLAQSGQRYLVVVEPAIDARTRQIRGMFSTARVQALLGDGGWSPTITRGMTSVMLRGRAANEPTSNSYA